MHKFILILLFPLLALAFDPGTAPPNWGLPGGGYSTIVLGTASLQMLPVNPNRTYLMIQNTGASQVIVKVGSAIAGSEGIQIAGGSTWSPVIPPINAIYGKAGVSTDIVQIIEGI